MQEKKRTPLKKIYIHSTQTSLMFTLCVQVSVSWVWICFVCVCIFAIVSNCIKIYTYVCSRNTIIKEYLPSNYKFFFSCLCMPCALLCPHRICMHIYIYHPHVWAFSSQFYTPVHIYKHYTFLLFFLIHFSVYQPIYHFTHAAAYVYPKKKNIHTKTIKTIKIGCYK